MAPIVNVETASPAGNPITTAAPEDRRDRGRAAAATKAERHTDRAAVSIALTHTSPPYPTIARRLELEGRVMLRLTILADGRVSRPRW